MWSQTPNAMLTEEVHINSGGDLMKLSHSENSKGKKVRRGGDFCPKATMTHSGKGQYNQGLYNELYLRVGK
jgi:hypothetical protein